MVICGGCAQTVRRREMGTVLLSLLEFDQLDIVVFTQSMPLRGPRHCVGISLGSAERRDAANSRTRKDGDCSEWVVFARDKLAQWKTRVKRAAKTSILPVEAFPVSGFAVQPAEMLTCVWQGMPWLEDAPVQNAREAMRVSSFRFQLSLSLVHDRLQDASSLDCALSKVPDLRSWNARVRHEYSWARGNGGGKHEASRTNTL